MPISLSDDELSAIMRACEPLAPEKRGAFLQAVADALATCPNRARWSGCSRATALGRERSLFYDLNWKIVLNGNGDGDIDPTKVEARNAARPFHV